MNIYTKIVTETNPFIQLVPETKFKEEWKKWVHRERKKTKTNWSFYHPTSRGYRSRLQGAEI